jgi:hypothetical protein
MIHPCPSFQLLMILLDPVCPSKVLRQFQIKHVRGFITQALISWEGASESLATWEPEEELHRRFPGVAAWGQAALQG